MNMNIELLEQSFNLLAPRGEELVERFYARLFEKYASVAPMFKNVSMAEQKKKLVASLVLVIQNLRRPDTLRNALMDLGARHVEYGTQPAHYGAVRENLLAVLEEFAGSQWSEEIKCAWTEALLAISANMLDGARQKASRESDPESSGRAA